MKEKIINKIKSYEFIQRTVLPFALTFSLSSAIFYAYGQGFFSVWSLAQAAIIAAAFLLFGFMQKHKVIGSIIYIVTGFFCLSLMFRFIFEIDWGAGFQTWFLSGGSETEDQTRYFLALLVSFPIFLASAVYYFSAVLYRTSFLMLSSLIPCALYVKILSDMSNMYLVLIAGLNILIYTVNNRGMGKAANERGKKAGIAAVGAVSLITLAVSSIIPKQNETPYYEVFENIFLKSGTGSGMGFNKLSDRSSDAGEYRDLPNTPLYDVISDDLVYLRVQSFDMYDPTQHNWYALQKYSTPDPSYYDTLFPRQELLNYSKMLEAMKKGCGLDKSLKDDFGISDELLARDDINEQTSIAGIMPLSHPANYALTTVRTFDVDHANEPFDEVNSTLHRQLTSGDELLAEDTSYSLHYFREFTSRNDWLISGGANFVDDEYNEFLDRLYTVLEKAGEDELCGYVNAFREDHDAAMEYKRDFSENLSAIPSDIADLAHTLTADCKYDWEKANTLQNFFHSAFRRF